MRAATNEITMKRTLTLLVAAEAMLAVPAARA
jgi:hypothetical protein